MDHLTMQPILHEDGRTWHVQVRFITSVPAVCHVEVGASTDELEATEAETEPLRNHRFDLPGAPGEVRFVRVIARAEEAEVASEVMEVRPPEPFPRGNVERVDIPLTVIETQGVARTEPVTFGIPLPEGALGDAGAVSLTDGPMPLPVQTKALVRWPDRSIKWLLLSANASLQANETKTLQLALGIDVRPIMPKSGDMVRENGDTIEVWTGQARLTIDRTTGEGTITADGLETPLPVSRLIDADGTVFLGRAESVEIEERGIQRAVIIVRGHHRNDAGEPYFGFTLRYFLNAGDAFVRVGHILQHDIVSADMQYGDEMKSFRSLDLVFPGSMASATVAVDGGATAQIAPGGRLFQHEDNAWELGETTGARAPGLATAGDLTVAVRDFWQNWPKAVALEEEGLAVGLYPQITPGDRYANRPNEHVLYYYLRDGLYTFRSGFEKRHELLVGPASAASPEEVLARVNRPLLVTAPREWYLNSGALHQIAAVGEEFEAWNAAMDEAADGHLEVREQNRWYGLMNFGDWWGERGNNWGNIEYDLQHVMLTQYFRSGDRRFFDLGEQAARHNADVDVVHYAAGQKAGPGNARRVGQAWVHSMGHTGGYYPYDYMNMSIYSQGYAENEGHMWNQGNFEYWLLTGDEQVHRAALQLADWLAGPDTVDFGYGNARVPGWMGIIAMSSWFATHDPYYLNAMHLIYEEVQEMSDPEAGLWVHKLSGGHCDCEEPHYGEAGFMAGVMMTALKYYYLATGDEEVAQRIVKIANWLVENVYDPGEDNFRYTSCPHTGIAGTSPLIMGNGLAFAANYSGDEKLMDLTRRTFSRAFVAFEGGSLGKSVAYGACGAPLAIYEISRFPGPTLDEVHAELYEVARDPARYRLPGIVPNPDFEVDLNGWRTRGLEFALSTEVAHTGNASAMASGPIEKQNEYFVTHYSCGPPWEIMALVPGEHYRMQLWLRVDQIGEGIPAPSARIAFRSNGVTRGGAATGAYDLARMAQWQVLQTEFEVPEGTDAAYIAVSTHTHDPQEVLMYLDDIAIVPAAAPVRETYVWASAYTADAETTGAVAAVDEGILDGWTVLASPDGAEGSATFTLRVPVEDEYRLLARVKRSDGGAARSLPVTINGAPAGEIPGGDDNWRWTAPDAADEAAALRLPPGEHTITITFPARAQVMLQSMLLTNAPVGQ